MRIGIADAELIYCKKHRFPNLAAMKISGYYKACGHSAELITDYSGISRYDKVFISKVFTDTEVSKDVLNSENVSYGGTGFFYDTAPPLSYEIEHSMPDYHLYDAWVEMQLKKGISRKALSNYTDYSIGFATRGCIRQCSFCVNKNSHKSQRHSSIAEFLDETRPYIYLLDDNVLACPDWKAIFDELIATGKRFAFKQGLDERLLTEEKCEYLFQKSKWIGDFIFAFDNIKDKPLIIEKLKLIRRYTDKRIKFYVLCAYNHNGNIYDEDFWVKDISDTFERIRILAEYGCIPYIMRHKNYLLSKYKGIYINLAAWCNQPQMFEKMTFADYCIISGMSRKLSGSYKNNYDKYLADGHYKGAAWRYYDEFCSEHKDIAKKYFNSAF